MSLFVQYVAAKNKRFKTIFLFSLPLTALDKELNLRKRENHDLFELVGNNLPQGEQPTFI